MDRCDVANLLTFTISDKYCPFGIIRTVVFTNPVFISYTLSVLRILSGMLISSTKDATHDIKYIYLHYRIGKVKIIDTSDYYLV